MSEMIEISPKGCKAVSVKNDLLDAIGQTGYSSKSVEIVTVCGDRTFSVRNEASYPDDIEDLVSNAANLCMAMCIDCPRKTQPYYE